MTRSGFKEEYFCEYQTLLNPVYRNISILEQRKTYFLP